MKTVTEVPHRMECFGEKGWTVAVFATPSEAAAFVQSNPQAAMPCWKRYEVIGDELVMAR